MSSRVDYEMDPNANDEEDTEAFDAFNDDTFGASADAWNEEDHEELAKLCSDFSRSACQNAAVKIRCWAKYHQLVKEGSRKKAMNENYMKLKLTSEEIDLHPGKFIILS